jgi:hypothetical protein
MIEEYYPPDKYRAALGEEKGKGKWVVRFYLIGDKSRNGKPLHITRSLATTQTEARERFTHMKKHGFRFQVNNRRDSLKKKAESGPPTVPTNRKPKVWELPHNGKLWHQMPGQDDYHRKMNFYLYRTGNLTAAEMEEEKRATRIAKKFKEEIETLDKETA